MLNLLAIEDQSNKVIFEKLCEEFTTVEDENFSFLVNDIKEYSKETNLKTKLELTTNSDFSWHAVAVVENQGNPKKWLRFADAPSASEAIFRAFTLVVATMSGEDIET